VTSRDRLWNRTLNRSNSAIMNTFDRTLEDRLPSVADGRWSRGIRIVTRVIIFMVMSKVRKPATQAVSIAFNAHATLHGTAASRTAPDATQGQSRDRTAGPAKEEPASDLYFPLRIKLAVSFSVLVLLMTGVAAWYLVRHENDLLRREAGKRLVSLTENLATNAQDPLLSGNELRLGPVIESTVQDEDVTYAYVMNHEGAILYHSEPGKMTGNNPPEESADPPRGVIEHRKPISVEGVKIGTAVVGMSIGYIQKAIESAIYGVLFLLLGTTAAGIVGIFLLSGYHMKKIERLLHAVVEVGEGHLNARVEAGGNDEIGLLAKHFNTMVSRIETAHGELERTFRETISALAAAVEARDSYTRGHCGRVARISERLGLRLGLDRETLDELELAAILHDIGKIGTGEHVLAKTGPLERDERGMMEKHPEVGSRILSSLSLLQKVGVYVRHHHERFDGTGYPDGLKGAAIPLPARIIALADAYDAMRTDRAYRRALSKSETLDRIRADSGTQFDPTLVAAFMEMDKDGVIDRIWSEVP